MVRDPVGDPLSHSFALAPGPLAPRSARASVAELPWIPPRLLEAATLLLSELVTNSVRHAGLRPGDTIDVRVEWNGRRLRVEVSDPGPGFVPPAMPRGRLPRPGGLGLVIVDRLANRWSVRRQPRTSVRFELL